MPIYLKFGFGPDPVEVAQDDARAARAETADARRRAADWEARAKRWAEFAERVLNSEATTPDVLGQVFAAWDSHDQAAFFASIAAAPGRQQWGETGWIKRPDEVAGEMQWSNIAAHLDPDARALIRDLWAFSHFEEFEVLEAVLTAARVKGLSYDFGPADSVELREKIRVKLEAWRKKEAS